MKTETMKVIDNELYMGSFSLKSLAEKYKTPLYIYDEVQILENIKKYKKYFKSEVIDCQVVYASKAFLAPRLASIMAKEGLFIDSVSYGDLYILAKSRFPLEQVLLHGNNKSRFELEKAVDLNVGFIVVDNLRELKMLESILKEKNKKINTLFRFNPGIQTSTHQYIQTASLDSKFGESILDWSLITQIVQIYKDSKHLNLLGFHAHIGSQIFEVESFLNLVETMLDFTANFQAKYDMNISVLDFGGGFGIKYTEESEEIDLPKVLTNMVRLVEERNRKDLDIKQIMIEPGRSIVGNAGVTLYTVGGLKTTYSGKNYLFVDGGMTDNIRPALYGAVYSHDIANRLNSPESIVCDIVGKCCESGDIIALNTKVNKSEAKDLLVVYTTGAYGYSMSSNYNGILRPAVLFVNNDKVIEVIRRETPEDLVATYNFQGE